MTRHFMDCRELPSVNQCTVSIAADDEDELLEAAVQHAVTVHHELDSPELRQELRRHFHEGGEERKQADIRLY
jgi:predicted small metal-binding protein